MITPLRRFVTSIITLLAESPEPLRRQCPSMNMGYLTKAFTTYGYDDLSLADLLQRVQTEVQEDTQRMHKQNQA